jgi:hypothetical protein
VERRVADLKALDLGGALNQLAQNLGDLWIGGPVVVIGALLLIPKTHSEYFLAARGNEGDLILESVLLFEQGNDLLVQLLGELRNAIGLQVHYDSWSAPHFS